MRTRTYILIGALLLVSAGTARAQQAQSLSQLERIPGTTVAVTVPDPAPNDPTTPEASAATTPATDPPTTVPKPVMMPKLGRFDVGYRGNTVKGDAARFNRYRDLTDGGYLDRFRFEKESESWLFHADANNVGYDNQRFGGQFQSIGKLKASFEYDQVPLFISNSTASLYTDLGNGRLVVDDAVQSALQAATATSTTARDQALNVAMAGAKPFDMKSRRDTGTFGMVYTLDPRTDVKVDVKSYDRSGYNLMSFGFGTSPGLLPALEMGIPMKDRSTTFKSQLEFANPKGLLAIGYDGSWYDNHIPTVQFDNPFRATDISGGPSVGQVPMWASNSSFAVNLNGSYKLPARTNASAAISVGQWNQNADLVPPTVNTALVAPPLERASAEARADITSMLYSVTSRPGRLWLNAKYRYYDYNNKTPVFEANQLVGDWALGTVLYETEPASMKRQTLDLDASFELGRYLGVGGGYTREIGDRSYRIFEKTTDDIYRVTIDSTGNQYVAVRAKFERSQRTGSGFDQALLDEVGEQPGTRHYDIADRDRDRFTTTVTFTPAANFDVNAAVSTGKDDYKNTGFGLRDNNNNAWNVGFDSTLAKTVNLGGTYGYEKYTANQYSRSANPPTPTDSTFYDPTRDWTLDQADKVKTYGLYADFNKTLPKTDIRLNYDLSDGKATYVYGLMPDQKLFTTTPLAQVAPLKNVLTDVRGDVQYYVRPNLALGFTYLYEQYTVDDFSLTDGTINKLNATNATTGAFASMIYSGYLYNNYKAHTGWLRLTYLW